MKYEIERISKGGDFYIHYDREFMAYAVNDLLCDALEERGAISVHDVPEENSEWHGMIYIQVSEAVTADELARDIDGLIAEAKADQD